jgi:hypothetical protein
MADDNYGKMATVPVAWLHRPPRGSINPPTNPGRKSIVATTWPSALTRVLHNPSKLLGTETLLFNPGLSEMPGIARNCPWPSPAPCAPSGETNADGVVKAIESTRLQSPIGVVVNQVCTY